MIKIIKKKRYLSKLSFSFLSIFTLASCTVIEPPPRSYPPARHIPVNKPKPKTKPIIRPAKKPPSRRPVITKPVVKPVPKPVVVKPQRDEPEQGVNPYDSIPQRTSATAPGRAKAPVASTSSLPSSSPAVNSLLTQAKADMLVKRHASAINKLERALRIEPQNPSIWHQLSNAYYKDGKDSSAISMAKKSNLYTAADSPMEKANWLLIKAASKRSGKIKTLKDAIRYEQTHPQ